MWAVPIGRLHCQPEFNLEQMAACGVATGAPVKTGGANVAWNVVVDTPLNEDLNDAIEDPDGGVLTFKLVPFHGPSRGVVTVNTDGTFTYTPQGGYNGPDRFYVKATEPTDESSIFEVLLGVGSTDSVNMTETPHVSVESWSVNYQLYLVTVAVKVAPNADKCEVWRLNAKMRAIDCNCVCYDHIDCFDIRMSDC